MSGLLVFSLQFSSRRRESRNARSPPLLVRQRLSVERQSFPLATSLSVECSRSCCLTYRLREHALSVWVCVWEIIAIWWLSHQGSGPSSWVLFLNLRYTEWLSGGLTFFLTLHHASSEIPPINDGEELPKAPVNAFRAVRGSVAIYRTSVGVE